MIRRLTDEAQDDRDHFEMEARDHGCTCFISPPCSHCTHPGNPLNQEDDDLWQIDEPAIDVMKAVRDMVGRP